MRRERDLFSDTLAEIRRRIRSGAFVGGAPLPITELAAELGLSATPVREAFSRLAGEGILVDARGRGYAIRRLDAPELEELYDLAGVYLSAAARRLPSATSGRAAEAFRRMIEEAGLPAAAPRFADRLLRRIAQASGNGALAERWGSLADRLAPVPRIEPLVIPDLGRELQALAERYDAGLQAPLERALLQYCARRRALAAQLARALTRFDAANIDEK